MPDGRIETAECINWELGRFVCNYNMSYLYLNAIRSGYAAPQNLQHYANYLDSRIRAYHDLKHDAVRVQAESNRDMRNSISIEEEGYRSRKDRNASKISSSTTPTRSKTMMGRKLRVMTVEKGLLRETKVVHRMIDALVECRVSVNTNFSFNVNNIFSSILMILKTN